MKKHTERQRQIYERLAITHQALESSSDAIIIADKDGAVVFVNPAFFALFGYTVTELNVGGIPEMLFQQPATGELIYRTIRQDEAWKGEVDLKTKNGETIPFLLHVNSIKDDSDQPIGILSIGMNISYQKRMNAILAEQRIIAEAQLDTAKALTSTLDLTEVFKRMLDNIGQVVTNDAANIILIQDGKLQLVDRDDYTGRSEIARLKTGEMPVSHYDDLRKILETNEPLVISNTRTYLEAKSDMAVRTPWLNSHLGIPIRLQNKVIGFLNVDSVQPGFFTQEHAERLQLFAEQAAIAIHNARLHERAQKLATFEERQRLAHNLHDAVSQTLFSANLIADAIPKLWQHDTNAVMPRLEQLQILNRGALSAMRSLLMELNPERLMETDIRQLIRQLVAAALGQTQIDVTLDLMEKLVLPPDVHAATYYIAQEALNNVVKHAEASQMTMRLKQQGNQVTLTVADNGRGFNTDQIPATSLGLNIIRERASATDAQLSITSDIGSGTQITVHWLI